MDSILHPPNSIKSIDTFNFKDKSVPNLFDEHLVLGTETMTIFIGTHGEMHHTPGSSHLMQSQSALNTFTLTAAGKSAGVSQETCEYTIFATSEFCNGRRSHRFLDIPLLYRESCISDPIMVKLIMDFDLNPNQELKNAPTYSAKMNTPSAESTTFTNEYYNKYFGVGEDSDDNARGIYLCADCPRIRGNTLDNLLNNELFKSFMLAKYPKKYKEVEIAPNIGPSLEVQSVVKSCLLSDIVEFTESRGIRHINIIDYSCALMTHPNRFHRYPARISDVASKEVSDFQIKNAKGVQKKKRKTRKYKIKLNRNATKYKLNKRQ